MILNKFHGLAIAALIAVLAFALFPVATDAFASLSLTCKQKISNSGAGAFYVRCRGATFFYDAGTCSGKCVGNPALPVDAADTIKALELITPASFVYLRMIDEDKKLVDNWIIVCYDKNTYDDVHNPRLRIFDPHTQSWNPTYLRFDENSGAMCTDFKGDASVAVFGVAK